MVYPKLTFCRNSSKIQWENIIGTGASIQRGGRTLFLWTNASSLQETIRRASVSNMLTLTYSWVSRVVVKNSGS